MGTSDFDAHTFAQHSLFAIGVKAHCPLEQNLRQWKRRALQPQYRPNDHCTETSTAPNGLQISLLKWAILGSNQ
jgi:hypothetical protein